MPEAPARVPRDAAVAVLVRPGEDGPEVFWLRREATLSFAARVLRLPRWTGGRGRRSRGRGGCLR